MFIMQFILIAATLKNWTLVLYGTEEDPQPPSIGKRHILEPGVGTCSFEKIETDNLSAQ